MHTIMEITDQFYSVLNDSEVKDRIRALGKNDADRGVEALEFYNPKQVQYDKYDSNNE
jgi:hypothetical protein